MLWECETSAACVEQDNAEQDFIININVTVNNEQQNSSVSGIRQKVGSVHKREKTE